MIKEVLNICNEALYYEYKGLADIEKIDCIREYIVDNFNKTKSRTHVLESLSMIGDIILKICFNGDIDNILRDVSSLRTKIISMIIADEKQTSDKTNTDIED